MQFNRRAASKITQIPPPVSSITSQQTKALQEQLEDALACKAELQQKLDSCAQESDALKKDVSDLRNLRQTDTSRASRAPVRPRVLSSESVETRLLLLRPTLSTSC
jgi:cell division protein FtsB